MAAKAEKKNGDDFILSHNMAITSAIVNNF